MVGKNQFDPDAYDKAPRKAGCSPFVLMVMIGLSVFLFVKLQDARRDRPGQQERPPTNADRDPGGGRSNARINEDLPRADQDDWSIEEVDTARKPASSGGLLNENLPDANAAVNPRETSSNPGERTDRGDWSIEEVDSNKKSPEKPKKTKKGDWEIEEVAE